MDEVTDILADARRGHAAGDLPREFEALSAMRAPPPDFGCRAPICRR